jgi:hypothetical protein
MKKLILSALATAAFYSNGYAQITDLTPTATMSSICNGENTTITTTGSQIGVSYSLRNSANAVIAGPDTATGASLTFNTGALSSTDSFNVYATSNNSVGLYFDGSDDHLRVNLDTAFDYSTGFSYETWVKTAKPGGASYHPILFMGTTGASNVEVYIRNIDLSVSYNRNAGGGSFRTYPSPPNNTWFHFAITFDGTNTLIYYDGVLQIPATSNGSGAITKTPNTAVHIGGITYTGFPVTVSSQKYTAGYFDDLRIWNTTRSASEISSNMTSCLTGLETGLEAFYKLNDGIGSIALDETGNNNAMLTNMDTSSAWTIVGEPTIGCTVSSSFVMTQTPIITVTTIDNSTNLVSQTLSSNEAGATYRWLHCDNSYTVITGETSASFMPTFSGNFAVEITLNTCIDTSACVNVTPSGINEINTLFKNVSIFPNPVDKMVNIDLGSLSDVSVAVYTLSGQVIHQENNIYEANYKFELNAAAGIYFVKISSEEQEQQYKLVKL